MKVEHKADEVTFFEDRARVERVCTVTLSAGAHTLELEGVSAAAVDRSIVARAPGVIVDDTTLKREWRIGESERHEDAQAIMKEFEKLREEAENIQLDEETAAAERSQQENLLQLTTLGLNREMPYAPALPKPSQTALVSSWATLRELDQKERALRLAHFDVVSRYEALKLRARQLAQPAVQLATTLIISLRAEQEGSYEVRVAYTVPCALWRPMHRAALSGDKLKFECAAAVWQATGETWADVRVRCSTARSTQRAEPPQLGDDWLATQERATKQVMATFHEQAIQNTGAGVASDEVPGVDDGGESRLLEAPERVTLRSNGRMQRVSLFSFEAKSVLDRICRPELTINVFLRAETANTSKYPLLAGPVELLREGSNVGLSTISFIAPGEKMTLSFGADDRIRVYRSANEHRETAKLTGKLTINRKVDLWLSNMDEESVSFSMEERIPVSELKEVDVEIDSKECVHPAKADEDGIVRYEVKLGAHANDWYKLAYKIEAGSSVKGL